MNTLNHECYLDEIAERKFDNCRERLSGLSDDALTALSVDMKAGAATLFENEPGPADVLDLTAEEIELRGLGAVAELTAEELASFDAVAARQTIRNAVDAVRAELCSEAIQGKRDVMRLVFGFGSELVRMTVANLADASRICRERGEAGRVSLGSRRLGRVSASGKVWRKTPTGWAPGSPVAVTRPGKRRRKPGRKPEECGVRCQEAIGPDCDCVCGGENHGVRVAALATN